MTTLERLGIQGVRSFSPDNLQTLSFHKPLTLIVGHNGAGKTTVVECLKMIVSGDLPPNADKGKMFIHDPKISGSLEVKAQIRLQFKTPLNKRVVATRSFQLTNIRDKKGLTKSTFKALESLLQTKTPDGATATMSKRCADMDTQIPMLLGVSKAIIDSVIFCHQEESNWPLGDMAALKKRFDAIFGATRYTKALKAVDDERKTQKKLFAEKLHALELCKTHLAQAVNLRSKIRSYEEKLRQAEDQKRTLGSQKAALNDEYVQAKKLYDDIVQYEGTITAKLENCSRIREDLVKCEEGIREVYEESLDELVSFLDRHSSSVEKMMTEIKSNKETCTALDDRLSNLNAEIDTAHQLSAEAYRIEERISHCNRTKADICDKAKEKFHLVGVENNESFDELHCYLRNCLDKKEEEHTKQKRAEDMTFSRLTSEIEKCTEELNQIRCETHTSNVNYERLTGEIQSLEKEYSQTPEATDLGCLRQRLSDLQNSSSEARCYERRSAEIDEKKNSLESELLCLQNRRSKLEKVQTQLREIETKKRKHQDGNVLLAARISELQQTTDNVNDFHSDVPNIVLCLKDDSTSTKLDSQINFLETSATGARQKADEYQRQHAELAGKIASTAQLLDTLEKELSCNKTELNGRQLACKEELVCKLEDITSKLNNAKRDHVVAENAKHIYSKFLQASEAKGKCSFCTRPFTTKDEMALMTQHVHSKLSQLPATIASKQSKVSEYSTVYSDYNKLLPVADNYERLLKDVTFHQSTLDLLTQKKEGLNPHLEESRRQANLNADALIKSRAVSASFRDIHKQHLELEQLQKEIDQLECNAAASLEETAEGTSLESIDLRITSVRVELTSLSNSKDQHQRQIHAELQQRAEQEKNLANLQNEINKAEAKKSREDELKEIVRQKKAELASIQQASSGMNEKNQEKSRDLEAKQEEKRRTIERYRYQLSSIDNSKQELQRLIQQLLQAKEHHEVAQRSKLEADGARQRIEDLVATKKRLSESLASRKEELEAQSKQLEDDRATATCVEKNIELRKKEDLLKQTESEIEAIHASLGGRNPVTLKLQLEGSRKQLDDIHKQMSHIDGVMDSTKEWLHEHTKELNGNMFKDIDKKYVRAVVEFNTHNLIWKDLTCYHSSLDKALMRYHSTKMTEINRCLKELWIDVYTADDIDYIAIRSDTDEGESAVASNLQGSRSYNYRLVTVKNGVELEMRGRCSAGQKVLASIIVRLALAESFCASTEILALDEPTTNLDKNNIRNLARALAKLIEARSQSSHFQLILITHDEEFLRVLARQSLSESFYKIQKNEQGYSTITETDISGYQFQQPMYL